MTIAPVYSGIKSIRYIPGTCPRGWRERNAMCYGIFSQRKDQKTWTDADKYCTQIGGQLLKITSLSEHFYIRTLTYSIRTQGQRAWIGISDKLNDGKFTWADGTDIKFKYYDTRQPVSRRGKLDCGYMITTTRTPKWRTAYCYQINPFMCKMPITSKLMSIPPPPTQYKCPTGWRLFQQSCFWFSRDRATFASAKSKCIAAGGWLANLYNSEEQSFISGNINANSWIGLERKTGTKFTWVKGTSNFTNFWTNYPNTISTSRCTLAVNSIFKAYWINTRCTLSYNYICRKDAVDTQNPPPTTVGLPFYPLCGAGWILDSVANQCYRLKISQSSWAQANSDCKRNTGGGLMSIIDLHEQSFISALMLTSAGAGQTQFWIGANQLDRTSGWRWSDSRPFRYFNWKEGSPVRFKNNDCAFISSRFGGMWSNALCSSKKSYICKKTAAGVSTTVVTGLPTTQTPPNCRPEAMISGNHYISPRQLTASSQLSARASPYLSRLDQRSSGIGASRLQGGWSPSSNNNRQWIQADFMTPILIKGVVTQGRADADEWVRSFRIRYKYDEQANWIYYSDLASGSPTTFSGNADRNTKKTNNFRTPFQARWIQLWPISYNRKMSLRWEVMGCLVADCTPEQLISGATSVPDSALKSSSDWNSAHRAANVRINQQKGGGRTGAWSAGKNDKNQWIQVDLGMRLRIKSIVTRGRPDSRQWVTSYFVQYGDDGKFWEDYQEPYKTKKLFRANKDQNSPVTNKLRSPFLARYVRILPQGWFGHVSMRMEVLGCPIGCQPQPIIAGPNRIPGRRLTATSSYSVYHGPDRSRLWIKREGALMGAWVPRVNQLNQFIQVDIGVVMLIKAVGTKGRQDADEWTKTYVLTFSTDRSQWFTLVRNKKQIIFTGNTDRNSLKKNWLPATISARYVRLWPRSWNSHIALRWEVYGCGGANAAHGLGCFSDQTRDRDLPNAVLTNVPGGMTQRICVNHCFNKGYVFAGLQRGSYCYCGNDYGKYGPAPASQCNYRCSGNSRSTCGGAAANTIFNTGLAPDNVRCPDGWTTVGTRCGKAISATSQIDTWQKQRTKCQNMGGELASILNDAEQSQVLSYLNSEGGRSDIWIGMNDLSRSFYFDWTDQRPVLYTKWAREQPYKVNNRGISNYNCVYMSRFSGKWYVTACTIKRAALCMTEKQNLPPAKTTPSPAGCPKGWTSYRYNCYVFLPTPRTWLSASSTCRSFGSTLVRIANRYEQAYITGKLSTMKSEFWSDLTDRVKPGTYAWTNGNTDIRYTHWAMGQPNDRTKGQCVAISAGLNNGLWYDRLCTYRRGTICQRRRTGYTTPMPEPTSPPSNQACEVGWIGWGANCFQVNEVESRQKLTWVQSLDDCNKKGGDLASFHNKTELDFIHQNFMLGKNGHFWIGLNNRDTKQGHVWTDGSSVAFTNWAENEPNNGDGVENCVEMYSDSGLWNDNKCDNTRNWVCKIPRGKPVLNIVTTPAPTPGPAGSCSPDDDSWKFYMGNCYFFSNNSGDWSQTWRKAEAWCSQNGGNLASIRNQGEQNFIQGQIKDLQQNQMWIGLNEIDYADGYKWTDKSPLNYKNWAPNEPNDWQGNEECVSMYATDGYWNDEHCGVSQGFICKKNKGVTAAPPTDEPDMPGYCPKGYSTLGNKCYKFFGQSYFDKTDWDGARKKCQDQGDNFDLASISNVKEQAFIISMMKDNDYLAWIGLRYRGGQFLWIDNSDFTYSNWDLGEPNGGNDEPCVHLQRDIHHVGKWNDIRCNSRFGYICQTKKQDSILTPEPTAASTCANKDFVKWGTSCYLLVRSAKTWDDADSYCKNTGANLVTISDEKEQSFIFSLLSVDKLQSPAWIGLSDKMVPGTFRWSDNWPIQYANWDKGQPSGTQTDDGDGDTDGGCVYFDSETGRWNDVKCTTKYPSVCKQTDDQPPYTPAPGNGSCPDDFEDGVWLPYKGSCYLFQPDKQLTYAEADFACLQRESYLVSIHSDDETNFLKAHLPTISGEASWIGLLKQRTGGFFWKDLSPVDYTNWNRGEPSDKDGTQGEDCVEAYNSGTWNDIACSAKRGYICKVTAAISGSTIMPATGAPPSMASTTDIGVPQTNPQTNQPVTGPGVITTTRSVMTNKPGSLKPFTWPPAGKTTKQTFVPPTPRGQTATKTATAGINGGEVVAIVIGVVVAVLLATLVAMFFRKKNSQAAMKAEGGFDNAVYSTNSDSVQVNNNLDSAKSAFGNPLYDDVNKTNA
ncbi:unnamed protein product [Owenia fusiformis]|uniref:Macrophage mannose receptor 1-like n=1 Tax=Owenia fusiformis TaxID=6347 RepID=A0A8S4PXR1_OWEFU|nr:unnamed protein product [Owenia fusiformis]